MQSTTHALAVQDILSVFADLDRTAKVPTTQVLVELLTADGLLILKMPPLMAKELMESLSRASDEEHAR